MSIIQRAVDHMLREAVVARRRAAQAAEERKRASVRLAEETSAAPSKEAAPQVSVDVRAESGSSLAVPDDVAAPSLPDAPPASPEAAKDEKQTTGSVSNAAAEPEDLKALEPEDVSPEDMSESEPGGGLSDPDVRPENSAGAMDQKDSEVEAESPDQTDTREERGFPAVIAEAASIDPWPAAPTPAEHADAGLAEGRREHRRNILIGALLVLAGFGGFGAWASLAHITSASIASGVVATSSGRQNVQHLEGGIIKAILVKEGEKVERGQVLIRLEDTQARTTLERLTDRHRVLEAREARLVAERKGLEMIEFPSELSDKAGIDSVREMLTGQRNLFAARRDAYEGQLAILSDRMKQLENQIGGYNAQRRAAREQLGFIQEELTAARSLLAKGIYEKPRVLALERTASGLRGAIGEYNSGVARAKEAIGETRSRAIDLENTRRRDVTTELEEVKGSLLDIEGQLRAAQDVVDRSEVRAPAGGIVVGLQFRTPGGVIPPRVDIMDIVPEDDPLIVEVRIRPTDIDAVSPGLPAEVRFTAFNFRTTPMILGEVVHVSADRFTSEQDGSAYYQGKVEVTPEAIREAGNLTLQPGMPAEVHIVTGRQTPLDYLMRPMMDSLSRAWREQ